MEIPDLSKLSQQQREALEEMAEEEHEPSPNVRTAFLVVVDENGQIYAQPDLDVPLNRAHIPTADDIYGACAVIQRDITVQMSAQQTVLGMQQMAMMQAQRLQEAQMLQGLNLRGK